MARAGSHGGASGSLSRRHFDRTARRTAATIQRLAFNGLASAGTLIRCGDEANKCGTVKLQFDAGCGNPGANCDMAGKFGA